MPLKSSRWCLIGLLALVGVISFWFLATGCLIILWPHQYGRFKVGSAGGMALTRSTDGTLALEKHGNPLVMSNPRHDWGWMGCIRAEGYTVTDWRGFTVVTRTFK
jgi:hypothetical protein